MDHDSASQLLGAYALDACDDAEAAAVANHLIDCAECRREIAQIERASVWLGVFETATPPGWLRAEIIREATNDLTGNVDRRAGVVDRRGRPQDRGPK